MATNTPEEEEILRRAATPGFIFPFLDPNITLSQEQRDVLKNALRGRGVTSGGYPAMPIFTPQTKKIIKEARTTSSGFRPLNVEEFLWLLRKDFRYQMTSYARTAFWILVVIGLCLLPIRGVIGVIPMAAGVGLYFWGRGASRKTLEEIRNRFFPIS